MQNGIILNTEDVKRILAEYFNVDIKNVIKSQYSYTVIKEESDQSSIED